MLAKTRTHPEIALGASTPGRLNTSTPPRIGELEPAAYSNLERRCLLTVRSRFDQIMVPLRGPALIEVVYAMLTPKERAAARDSLNSSGSWS